MRTSLSLFASLVSSLVISSASAGTIPSNGKVNGNWSSPALWTGGVVPGAADTATFTNLSTVVYDSAASGSVTAISGNATTFTLGRDLTAQNLYLRECTLSDGGKKLTVTGTLSNYLIDGYEGNGGARKGQGGNLSVGELVLGRASMLTFYPGDSIQGSYTTSRIRNSWPDISVVQDASAYGSRLDQGLSFDGASGKILLGSTSATDQAEITLNWDGGLTGNIDWTLRWKGNHVSELQSYFSKGQLKIGTVPTGMAFDQAKNIFYHSATDYTYVGFRRTRTYDVAKEFSLSSNPNGVWTYGSAAGLGKAPTNFSKHATAPLESGAQAVSYWNTGASSWDAYHGAFANLTAAAVTVSAGLVLDPGMLVLHPANNGAYAVARFTAPEEGSYQVDAMFKAIDAQAKKTDAAVLVNLVAICRQDPMTKMSMSCNKSDIMLKRGDTVDFVVGNGGDGFGDDAVQLVGTVTFGG